MSLARFWRPAAALLAMLWVLAVNGGPLVYFDSISYVDQGRTVWRILLRDRPAPVIEAPGDAVRAAAGDDGDDETVNLSRSVVYPAVVGLFDRLRALAGVPVAAAAWVALTLWLAARPLRRGLAGSLAGGLAGRAPPLVALPLFVAGFGALPFYIAYLMPDIFAPTLLLSAGVLAAFGRDLRGWEIALATFIALSSIVMHPSHLLIAIGLLPVAVAIGLISGLRRWWIGPLALALAAGIGLAERVAIPMAASKISDGAEVVYLPILTARIIVDGPGWDYLEAHCPDADIPTCALYESLSRPGDPMRMTATHIVFETSPELGSYRLLDKETQRRIGQSQTGFFRDVLLYDPFGVAMAFWYNTLEQAQAESIDMTIASEKVVASARSAGIITTSRMTADRSWIPTVEHLHSALYLLSLVVIAVLLVLPGRLGGGLSRGLRAFALFLLLGILANAFVCGGVSQPATRYGARVIWLLPYLATLMAVMAWSRRGAARTP